MKRDNELVRRMMLVLEASDGKPDFSELTASGVSEAEIRYHSLLLKDARLAVGPPPLPQSEDDLKSIRMRALMMSDGPHEDARIARLTWEGHEFLDAARDPKRWASAMSTVKELGGAVTFAGVKALLTVLMEQTIGAYVNPRAP